MRARIEVNGESREIDPGLTLQALLTALELPELRVAVERNHQVVPRSRFAAEPIEDGDKLEIVTLVGGG